MNSKAYTYTISPQNSGSEENNIKDTDNNIDFTSSVQQTSPAWVLTFLSWNNRDTYRDLSDSSTTIRGPLIVTNDCITLSINYNKGSLTPNLNAVLIMSDINYETAIAPGDFVFANILNWQADANRVALQANNTQPINGINDGFKGLFKVQSVRRTLNVDPITGIKVVTINISGYAFTEFNNSIYFNQYLLDTTLGQNNNLLFATFLGQDFSSLINAKAFNSLQDIITILIQSFIGTGIVSGENEVLKESLVNSNNPHFLIPQLVGTLLGIPNATAAKDIYNYLFGIQLYNSGNNDSTTLSDGMNPILPDGPIRYPNFYYTPNPCEGNSILKPEYWNQVQAWAILNQYCNAPLNELYTCFRVSPTGNVMPTVVFRQMPFTTESFSVKIQFQSPIVTKFLSLPRWKISPALVLALDIGRDEAARINFVQFFGKSSLGIEGADISQEIAQGNYVSDINDVVRNGLRPYIVQSQFDDPTDLQKNYRSPLWASIIGDSLIGGHLKLNGTIRCAGIVEPIAVGDNLEFDGIVYHIEQINHIASINPDNGISVFRTTISLSNGVSAYGNSYGNDIYAEMKNTNGDSEREEDYSNNQILPGISSDKVSILESNNNNSPFPQGLTLITSTNNSNKT